MSGQALRQLTRAVRELSSIPGPRGRDHLRQAPRWAACAMGQRRAEAWPEESSRRPANSGRASLKGDGRPLARPWRSRASRRGLQDVSIGGKRAPARL